jgi:hypothetical protein
MRTVVIVIVLPLPQLLIEQVDIVGDAACVQELVELLVIDAMGPFAFAIEVRSSGANVGVAHI